MSSAHSEAARFVTGSPLHHVVVMAGTGAVGLLAIFGVDLLNLFYISLLGQRAVAAAVGFAGAVTFFQISLAIGLTIGVAATVSRRIGAGQMDAARRVAACSLALMAVVLALAGLGTVVAIGPILDLLGATGESRDLAAQYLAITSLSLPLLAVGMCCSALLRSVGDATRSMNVTLVGAVVTAALDPVLILALHLDLDGAAISAVASRLAVAGLGWYGVRRVHSLVGALSPSHLRADIHELLTIAGPAVLTNLATPVGSMYVTRSMARFGPEAVAGQATIDRIAPVAFCMIYALSGAIGPIVAQNLGAGLYGRVRAALRDALLFVLVTVALAWGVLAAAQDWILLAFSAEGQAETLVRLFCSLLAGSYLFTGALYVSNAAFNNLGHPTLSTLFNWGRATLGTVPLVAWGSAYGPAGVLAGQAAGSLLFGCGAAFAAFWVAGRLGGRVPGRPHLHVALPAASAGGAALATYAAASPRPRRLALWSRGRARG